MGQINMKNLLAWRKRIGYKEALDALMQAGISESLAQKVLSGGYKSKLTPIFQRAIQNAMDRSP
jgi:NAD-specific glutamate dehydrogenase